MKYFLIASNKHISDDTIDSLEINKEDVVILFNYIRPYFTFTKLQNVKRKYAMLRIRSQIKPDPAWSYAGIDIIAKNIDSFERVYLFPEPKKCSSPEWIEFARNSLRYYGLDQSQKLWTINLPKKIISSSIPSNKNLSSGLLMYLYISNVAKKPEDQIVLVGFTSSIAKKFHDPDVEKHFFNDEQKAGRCLMV